MLRYSRLSNTSVVFGTVKGQAPVPAQDVEAALIFRACVSSRYTFVNVWVGERWEKGFKTKNIRKYNQQGTKFSNDQK